MALVTQMSSNGKAPWSDENHSFSLCLAKFIFRTVKHFLSPKAGNTMSRFLSFHAASQLAGKALPGQTGSPMVQEHWRLE